MASGLLGQLELKGKVVTGDALYCQRELSLRVQEQGGDYFWMLKGNQPGMTYSEYPWRPVGSIVEGSVKETEGPVGLLYAKIEGFGLTAP